MARLATLCLLVAVAAAACTPTSEPDATTSAATTVIPSTTILTTTTEAPDGFGGAAIIGVTEPVTTLNPFSENAPLSTNMAGQAVWATVYDILPDTWERIPNVVTSLPSQTPDGIEVAEDG
jgi:ABC-type transport system substrate-binding protein